MSSGFVSGGTIDNPTERDDAWLQAQAELEENRRRKEQEGQQDGGKSLFEVLQANKDAKQAAFEEANRLKNQFRALNDDEAEYLDSVLETTRKQEAAVRKETREQLDLFRKQQEETERKALLEENAGSAPTEEAQWSTGGRKRKKGSEKDGGLLKGVKLRKASSSADAGSEAKRMALEPQGIHVEAGEASRDTPGKQKSVNPATKTKGDTEKKPDPSNAPPAASPTHKQQNAVSLGLGYASSDEDD